MSTTCEKSHSSWLPRSADLGFVPQRESLQFTELFHWERVRLLHFLCCCHECLCDLYHSALYHANTYVKMGVVECAMALGFEQMASGSLGSNWTDRPPPLAIFSSVNADFESEDQKGPMGLSCSQAIECTLINLMFTAPRFFSNAAQEYFDRHGGSKETLAKIAAKNHKHSKSNPYSQFRQGWTVEQVLKAPDVTKQSTKLMCCPVC